MGLLATITGYCQVIVSGKVNDVNGAPIPYATIEFVKAGQSSGKITDSIGGYTLYLSDTGSYTVKVASLGFKDSAYNCMISQSIEAKDFLNS